MSKIITSLLCIFLIGCATIRNPTMTESAIADTVSTYIGIEHSGKHLVEKNPMGFPATIVLKASLIYYTENYASLENKNIIQKSSSSFWSGAAVNNILLLFTTPQVSLFSGIVTSVIIWKRHDEQIKPTNQKVDG